MEYERESAAQERKEAASGTDSIADYKLPVVDVCVERRNFPGYQKYDNLAPDFFLEGDSEGTTKTSELNKQGFTRMSGKRI